MATIWLVGTKTHACRECVFDSPSARQGTLTIREGKSRRTLKCTGRYVINEHEPTYCRRFHLEKSDGQEYWVGIGDEQKEDSCDCVGFEAYGHCKHAEIMRLLVNGGLFPA